MDLKQYRCKNCGGADNLKIDGDTCECKYCGSIVRVDTAQEYMTEVRKVFGEALAEQKEEQVANCRRNLWKAVHAEYVSSEEVLNCVRDLKKLLPDDFQANFFEVATSGTPQQLNSFLRGVDIARNGVYIGDMADYILRNLESSSVLPLKDLITRGLKNEKYTEYITKVEDEAEKLKQGIYSPQVPRDVFLAYSSKDFAKVNEIAEFLEGNKISCFVALRNLRHGRGSVENYLKNLQTAMHNCKCVVFLSSENSRDLDCDALKVELPYIKDNEPDMGRIEYILSDYGSQTTYAAKLILEDFFNGREYCRTKEDLLKRILRYTTGIKGESAAYGADEKVKYCVSCGKKNPLDAKRCMECGSAEFASSYEAYLREKLEKEYAAKYQSQPQVGAFNHMGAYNPMGAAEAAKRAQEAALRQSEIAVAKAPVKRATPSNAPQPDFEMFGTVLKRYKGNKSEVVIPEGVTAIADETFWWNNGIKSVIIPQGVTSIGKNAFYNCGNLASVEIPDGVTSIGERAFSSCSKLASITIPESVTAMGTQVFSNCSKLKTINCGAQGKPKTWDGQWIGYCMAEIVWGYKS
ncbi:MAG: leucine-rich repeat protein [Clostridiales bacterium]|nr:leucine-rich repeat protein [Clostridiales bacterium]